MEKQFNYDWSLENTCFEKDKGTVFSCFACGGGSSMGYKLAGFDVIGCNEIDEKMMEVYRKNLNPKFYYCEPIQNFKLRKDLPPDLYNLDILDGSPPCSNFSMCGNREKDWGKEKVFREGQAKQVLDTLFFDFIDLAKELQPKVVVSENVKGILAGNAKKYVMEIYRQFDLAGYYIQHFILDFSRMGVPQKRKRVFFIALKKNIGNKISGNNDLFGLFPELEMNFTDKEIAFKEIEEKDNLEVKDNTVVSSYYDLVKEGQAFSFAHENGSFFNDYKVKKTLPINVITADANHGGWHYNIKKLLSKSELVKAGSFPSDYDFLKNQPKYIIGMSVPPVMMAKISWEIYKQWLAKL